MAESSGIVLCGVPVNMPVCAITGPVLVWCSQHWPSIDPVLAHNGMFTGVFLYYAESIIRRLVPTDFVSKCIKHTIMIQHRLSKLLLNYWSRLDLPTLCTCFELSRLIFLVAYSTGWPSMGYSISYLSVSGIGGGVMT